MNDTKRVLIIEDDDDIRELLVESLQGFGYVTSTATDGLKAIQLLQSCALPHLILLDLMMPIMDGTMFCIERRKNADLKNIPVILMSADRRVADISRRMDVCAFIRPLDSFNLAPDLVDHYKYV